MVTKMQILCNEHTIEWLTLGREQIHITSHPSYSAIFPIHLRLNVQCIIFLEREEESTRIKNSVAGMLVAFLKSYKNQLRILGIVKHILNIETHKLVMPVSYHLEPDLTQQLPLSICNILHAF